MDEKHEFYTLDETGQIEAVDIHTGEARTIIGSALSQSLESATNSEGDLVYIHKDMPLDTLGKLQGGYRSFPYSPLLADRICEKIANGATLVDICGSKGMPSYGQLASWRRKYPEFNDKYNMARRDRAEIYFDNMLKEVANAAEDRDSISLARLRADFYKFAAKVSSPEEYAERTTIDAKGSIGVFTIDTGVRREGDTGYNADETKLLENTTLEIP